MSCFGAMIGANRQLQRDLSTMGPVSGNRVSSLRSRKPGSRRPISFVRCRDPLSRFELSYPAEWKLHQDLGVHVSSARLGSFARVDVLPGHAAPWKRLQHEAAEAGGSLRITTRGVGTPETAAGTLAAGERRFSWMGYAWRIETEIVVLFLGKVVDPSSPRAIEGYEDRILKAIRRQFRVGPLL
jgi:hypothetical protein